MSIVSHCGNCAPADPIELDNEAGCTCDCHCGCNSTPTHPVDSCRDVDKRIEVLEHTFRHYHSHIGKDDGDDSCATCGLDIRDGIHERVRP